MKNTLFVFPACLLPFSGTSKKILAIHIILTLLTMGMPILTNAQTTADTTYAKELITVRGDKQTTITHAEIEIKPLKMEMITPDTTYKVTTDDNGIVKYKLPVYIDTTTTGIRKNKTEKEIPIQTYPNPANKININTNNKTNIEKIIIYNIQGKKIIETKPENKHHAFINLEKQPNGTYIYIAKTNKGIKTGKIIKTNNEGKENNKYNTNNTNNTNNKTKFKTTNKEYTAKYQFIAKAKNYYNDTIIQTIKNNQLNYINLIMTPLPPGNITIIDTVKDLETNNKLENVIANLYIADTLFASDTTKKNGTFTFKKIPQKTTLKFEIGGLKKYYAFKEITGYKTPDTIPINKTDTITGIYETYLIQKDTTTTATRIREQVGGSLTRQDTIYYDFNNNEHSKGYVKESDREQYRKWFKQLTKDENNIFIFKEKKGIYKKQGIFISTGEYGTQTSAEGYQTPIEMNYPIKYATTNLGSSRYIVFVHEIKRGLGFREVPWNSVMNTNARVYTREDKQISKIGRKYYNKLYKGKTNFRIRHIKNNL